MADVLPTTSGDIGAPPPDPRPPNILSCWSAHATNGYLVVTLPPDPDTELVEKLHLLLEDIVCHRYKGLIIDLSRVDILPSKVAKVIAQLASAAKLLDSPAAICGIKPSLAAAMSTLGIGFEYVPTARDLDGALALLPGLRSVGKSAQPGIRNPQDKSRASA